MPEQSILQVGALYVRVSTHDQDDLSPDAQIRLGLDYAKKNNIMIPKEYIFVESVSGRKAKNRHEFQKMIGVARSSAHPIDIIIVWKFSRFARNQEESIVYKSMLKKDNVDVVSISEPLIDGPFGSLIERIIEWMDEYYSIRLSGEVLRGMNEKALRNGYQMSPPLGYNAIGNGKPFIINEEDFKIISYIFEHFDIHDKDSTSIARDLNDLGYRTQRGSLFEKRTIDRILTNPFYYGLVRWNGTEFIGSHEVRLTKEQFDKRMEKIQKRYSPRKRRSVSTCKHWLSGLVKCGYCGTTFSYSSSGPYPYFQCWKYSKGIHRESCAITEKKLVSYVYEYFKKILCGAEFTYKYCPPEKPEQCDTRKKLLSELEKLNMRENRIKLAYEKEIDTLEEYAENKKRLREARRNLELQLSELKDSVSDAQPSKEDVLLKIQNVYDIIKNPDVDYETKGNIMRSLVESITYDKENHSLEFILYVS